MLGKRWTAEEDRFLELNYTKGVPWLMEELGRSKDSVQQKLSKKQLFVHIPFTDSEDNFIKDNYMTTTWTVMAKTLGRAIGSLRKRAVLLGLEGNRDHLIQETKTKYQVDKDYFSAPNIENCYWAGFIAADGCLRLDGNRYRLRIGLQERDHWHLEKFAYDVNYTGPVIRRKRVESETGFSGSGISDLNITGVPEWHQDLYKHFNITPAKTLTLKGPNLTDFDLSCAYMKGLLDGDGSIIVSGGYLSFVIYGTKDVLSFIKNLIDSNFRFYGTHRNSSQVNKRPDKSLAYKVKGRRADEILGYLDTLKTPFLERKWVKIRGGIR